MLNSLIDILNATGPQLLQPINFGPAKGLFLDTLPMKTAGHLAALAKLPHHAIGQQVTAARAARKAARPIWDESKRAPMTGLYDWQLNFARDFAGMNYGGLFAEMGTGKTLAMLNLVRCRWAAGDKVLIICPKSVFSSWSKHLDKFLPKAVYNIATGTGADKTISIEETEQFCVTNYETVLNMFCEEAIRCAGFTWLILDESHRVKNHSAKTTKKINELAGLIEMRFAMTGTPITKNIEDLYSQVSILDRGAAFGRSRHWFRKQYFKQDFWGGWSVTDMGKEKIMSTIKPFTVRIQKADVLDLPEKVFLEYTTELSGLALKTYKTLAEQALLIIDSEEIPVHHKIAELIRLRQITGGHVKDPETGQGQTIGKEKIVLLQEVLESTTGPVVIVCNFKAELREVAELLDAPYIDGSVKDENRAAIIDQFSTGDLPVMIINQRAGGVGIDGLQNYCSTMIFYSNDYGYEARVQCEDRLHRSGQVESCTYIDIVATLPGNKPTIDSAILQALGEKTADIKSILKMVRSVLC